MYVDKGLEFSDKQAVTVTTDATNIIDLGATDIKITPKHYKALPYMDFIASVYATFVGGTSLQIRMDTSDDVAFTTSKNIFTSAVILVADLTVGEKIAFLPAMPLGTQRYLKVSYTVAGIMTAGKINTFITVNGA